MPGHLSVGRARRKVLWLVPDPRCRLQTWRATCPVADDGENHGDAEQHLYRRFSVVDSSVAAYGILLVGAGLRLHGGLMSAFIA